MKAYLIPIIIAVVSALVIAWILNPSAIQGLKSRIGVSPNVERK